MKKTKRNIKEPSVLIAKNPNEKMKKIMLIVIVGLFLISFASATQQTLGTFKRGECIPLSQTCGNCTYNNVTSVLKTGENQIIYNLNVSMTKNDIYYNYTFCGAQDLGIYNVHGFGNPDGTKISWIYDFEITSLGINEKSILNNSLLLILIILFLVLFLIAIKTQIAWLGFISSLPLILLGIYTMIYGFNNITNMYTRGSAFVILGFGIVIMFYSVYEWLFAEEGGDF